MNSVYFFIGSGQYICFLWPSFCFLWIDSTARGSNAVVATKTSFVSFHFTTDKVASHCYINSPGFKHVSFFSSLLNFFPVNKSGKPLRFVLLFQHYKYLFPIITNNGRLVKKLSKATNV